MNTGNVEFIRGRYFATSIQIDRTKIKYQLQNNNQDIKDTLLTEIVRLELDNGYHDRSRQFEYWLYFRNDTNWSRCSKTGLAKTCFNWLFEGNISRELDLSIKNGKGKNFETEQHLVIVQSTDIYSSLTVDVFKNFYVRNKKTLQYFNQEHYNLHGIN